MSQTLRLLPIIVGIFLIDQLSTKCANGLPVESTKVEIVPKNQELDKYNYVVRSWGDSACPFCVSYSEYARNQQLARTSTLQPKSMPTQTRRRKSWPRYRTRTTTTTTTTPTIPIKNMFISQGWGPGKR